MTTESPPGASSITSHVVLDAGPLLTGQVKYHEGTAYYTTPQVINEIKDAASKARLAFLPITLNLVEPSGGAVRTVWEVARDVTGDAGALSKNDLLVVALTLELAQKKCGFVLDMEAIKKPIAVHDGKPVKRYFHSSKNKNAMNQGQKPLTKAEAQNDGDENNNLVNDDSDEGEWITPENVSEKKNRDLLKIKESEKKEDKDELIDVVSVQCITSDFAMQNVLLRMGLQVKSLSGHRITCLKAWMLRCHACYWYTADARRKFCDKCGGPTLLKTSYMLDEAGQPHFFLARNFQYRLRGTQFDMPMPQGGRCQEMITREDQKEYLRALKSQTRSEQKELKALLSENTSKAIENIDDRLAGVFGSMEIAADAMKKKQSTAFNAFGIKIGAGRRNPNEVRQRRK